MNRLLRSLSFILAVVFSASANSAFILTPSSETVELGSDVTLELVGSFTDLSDFGFDVLFDSTVLGAPTIVPAFSGAGFDFDLGPGWVGFDFLADFPFPSGTDTVIASLTFATLGLGSSDILVPGSYGEDFGFPLCFATDPDCIDPFDRDEPGTPFATVTVIEPSDPPTIPEPGTITLLLLGIACLLTRYKHQLAYA